MALPLLWLGAAIVGAIAAKDAADNRKLNNLKRRQLTEVERLSVSENVNYVGKYPTELLHDDVLVKPLPGSLVCCGIAGVLDHTGIWIDDDTIVELDGNGLIKGLSSHRFTHNRSGSQIFIACDSLQKPLVNAVALERAKSMIFNYREYDVIDNNCHRFAWWCFSGLDEKVTTFAELNVKLATFFDRKIYWDKCLIG